MGTIYINDNIDNIGHKNLTWEYNLYLTAYKVKLLKFIS